MATDILRKVGWALIVVGLIDIGFMVYCIVNEISYSSSLNVFAVVAGILLVRESMKAARLISIVAAFMLGSLAFAAILFQLLMPFDLLVVHFRVHPLVSIASVVFTVALIGFAYWVYRSLTSPVVMEARRAAGVSAKQPVIAFVAGIVVAVGMFTLMAVMTQGRAAEYAIAEARNKTGPGYKYHVTSMHWSGNSGRATVTAYNSAEIKDVRVEW